MGLTIHYGLTSRTRSTAKAKNLVERMRQLALDLPFESVDEQVQQLGPDVCQQPLDDLRQDDRLFSAVLDGCKHVPIPWHRKQSGSISVQPLEIFSFWTVPGPGSEWASFGLARYPAEIEVTYCPMDDDKFTRRSRKAVAPAGSSTGNAGGVGCKATAMTDGMLPTMRSFRSNGRSRPGSPRLGDTRRSARLSTQATSDAAASPISSAATYA